MSWQALAWAGKLTVGSPAAKSLLILLANFADEAGECYPTFEKLSEMSELSYRAVQDNIAKLESLGLIERNRKRNALGHLGITRYRLCLDVQSVATHRQEMPVEPPATDSSGPPADNSISHRQQVPVKETHQDKSNTALNAREDVGWLGDRLIEAAGDAVNPVAPKILSVATVRGWLASGADLEIDVLPYIRSVCAGRSRHSIRTWDYFTPGLADAVEARRRGLPAPTNTGGPHARTGQGAIVSATLDRIAEQYGSGGDHRPAGVGAGAGEAGLRRGAA